MQQEEGDRTLLSPPHPPPPEPPPTPTPNPHPTRRSAWQVWRKIHINAHCQAEKQSIKRVVTYDWGLKQSRAKKIIKDKQTKSKREPASIANSIIPASSNQAPIPVVQVMDTSSSSKRAEPETRIEPRGIAGRPKMHKAGTERGDVTKRYGSEPEDTTSRKKISKKKT